MENKYISLRFPFLLTDIVLDYIKLYNILIFIKINENKFKYKFFKKIFRFY
jgi:hypothetical protein